MFKFTPITEKNFYILEQLFDASGEDWVSAPDQAWIKYIVENKRANADLVLMLEEPIGYIQYDEEAENDYSVLIFITKKYRGQGLGTEVLIEFLHNQPNNRTFVAYIESDNLLSIKVFEKAGFEPAGFDEKKEMLKFTYSQS